MNGVLMVRKAIIILGIMVLDTIIWAIMLGIIIGAVIFSEPGAQTTSPIGQSLIGQGSTFIYPLMTKWIEEYKHVRKNVIINYQPTGSGAGIRAIIEGSVDFACSDAPMNSEEWRTAEQKGTVLQFPVTLGGIVIIYNLPGLKGRLRLNGTVLADIYLGKISKWNDPAIQQLNPDLNLPDRNIIVVKRSDSSGTTYIFTDYLSSVSKEWAEKYGKTKIFAFDERIGDRGIAAQGNPGVAQAVIQNPFSIGYLELTYAEQIGINFALIQNKDGYFVDANLTTIAEAAKNAYAGLPEPDESWENVTIVNQPGRLSYPIVSFVYMIVYKEQRGEGKLIELRNWIRWILTNGQEYADDLYYVPLPENVRNIGLNAADMLTYTLKERITNITNYLVDFLSQKAREFGVQVSSLCLKFTSSISSMLFKTSG